MKNTRKKLGSTTDQNSNACINFPRHRWATTGASPSWGGRPQRGYQYQRGEIGNLMISTLRESDLVQIRQQAEQGKRLTQAQLFHFSDDLVNELGTLLKTQRVFEMDIETVATVIFVHASLHNFLIVRELWIYGLRREMNEQELDRCLDDLWVKKVLSEETLNRMNQSIKEARAVLMERCFDRACQKFCV